MSAEPAARRSARTAELVLAVTRQFLHDRGAGRLALLEDGSPEAALLARMLAPLGDALLVVTAEGRRVDSVLHAAGVTDVTPAARLEAHRLLARLSGAPVCSAATKTDLLVGGELPPECLLPLGDLWASQVAELGGGWRGSEAARDLAAAAGGVVRLDEALRALLDLRDGTALERLPAEVAGRVRDALAAGAASRVHPRIVPKLGPRTLGVDLFE